MVYVGCMGYIKGWEWDGRWGGCGTQRYEREMIGFVCCHAL